MKTSLLSSVSGVVLAVAAMFNASAEKVDHPYGVCAHVSRGEQKIASREFNRMKEANISWVRTDFDWSNVERKKGEWTFSRLDQLMELAERKEINILPILGYHVTWAAPVWQHLDAWGEYVHRTVSRYAPRLRCWEVWNEQNAAGFWRGGEPSGASYVPLLQRAYEEIRKIDPKLRVLYGGTAGVPLHYIEDSFRAGAGKYFDIMNIHPYNWQGLPEQLIGELQNLQKLMKKYGLSDKPIWITEVGWSTATPPEFYQRVLPVALKRAGISPSRISAAVLCDMEKNFSGAIIFKQSGILNMFRDVVEIKLDQLQKLSVSQYPVLFPTFGEVFPGRYIPALVNYVKRGGTLLLPAGLPFYYDLLPDGRQVQVNKKYLKELHIDWEAWWTEKHVPKKASWQKPAPEFEGAFTFNCKPSERFLHDGNLMKGDQFIPIVLAGTDSYTGSVAALYKFNSNLKGNIIACTMRGGLETVSESMQAKLLPRIYIIAMAHGVKRIFWYNFRAAEWSLEAREAHFGIVRKNLDSKPSFHAYQTLTRLCPSGSTLPVLTQRNNIFLASWSRPDQTKVWAVWTPLQQQKVKFNFAGGKFEAFNHLGQRLPLSSDSCTISPAMIYFVGPQSISIKPN